MEKYLLIIMLVPPAFAVLLYILNSNIKADFNPKNRKDVEALLKDIDAIYDRRKDKVDDLNVTKLLGYLASIDVNLKSEFWQARRDVSHFRHIIDLTENNSSVDFKEVMEKVRKAILTNIGEFLKIYYTSENRNLEVTRESMQMRLNKNEIIYNNLAEKFPEEWQIYDPSNR